MGLVGNFLWAIGRKIRVAPSTKQQQEPGKRQQGKRREKAKQKVRDGGREVDLDALKMDETSPLVQIER